MIYKINSVNLFNKPIKNTNKVLPIIIYTSPKPVWEEKLGNVTRIRTQDFSKEWNNILINDFDEIRQFKKQIKNLLEKGYSINNLELKILGGIWDSYPKLYQEEFIRNIFYAANTYFEKEREPCSLEKENYIQKNNLKIKINEINIENKKLVIENLIIKEKFTIRYFIWTIILIFLIKFLI